MSGLPTSFTLTDAMGDVFRPWYPAAADGRDTWGTWKAIIRATFALPMTDDEVEIFRSVAGGREPPERQVREAWIIGGRRGGKDSVASTIAAFYAAFYDFTGLLRPGEKAVVMLVACDSAQATICLDLIKAFFDEIPMLKAMKVRDTLLGVELNNGCAVEVVTNSARAPRGRSVVCCVLDEVGHFHADDRYKNPDERVYKAIKPGTLTLPGAMIIGISTPWAKRGLLYTKYRKHFGEPGDTLVIKAPSWVLNPSLDRAAIDEEFEDDPQDAAAEYGAEFRDDVGAFVSREAIEALVEAGVRERAPRAGLKYFAFLDPAGGAGTDSFTAAVTHQEDDRAVLDALREWPPPFSPAAVCAELAGLLQDFRVCRIEGDRFAGEFVREPLRVGSLPPYRLSERNKNEIYRDALPIFNSARAVLLDHQRMVNQFVLLERRTARGRSDVIDHPARGRDDLSNAAAGAILMAAKPKSKPPLWPSPPPRVPFLPIYRR